MLQFCAATIIAAVEEVSGVQPGAQLNSMVRGMQALELLVQGGAMTISSLAQALDLPRPNIYRIIHTLETTGYCRRVPESALYIATDKVVGLARSLSLADRVVNAAIPVFEQMREDIEWPVALAMREDMQMRIRLSTDRGNSRAIGKFPPGKTTPLLKTTTGILAIALSPDDRREADVADLAANGQLGEFFFGDEAMLRRVLQRAQLEMYALNDSRYVEGSIGVPIMLDGMIVAGITMKYIRAGMDRQRILSLYLPRLRAHAQRIADATQV